VQESLAAEILLEKGLAGREAVRQVLSDGRYASEAGRPLLWALAARGAIGESDMVECENELAVRQKRRREAAFGRAVIEQGSAGRADFDRILADTGAPWEDLADTLIRAGAVTPEQAESAKAASDRRLRESEAESLLQAAGEAEVPARALARARQELAGLPSGDGRSLLDLLVERGSLAPEAARRAAVSFVMGKVEGG
jgi:hypothetical protein